MTEAKSVELNSFIGVKAGMTRIFDENGIAIPVTVVKLINNTITQVRTQEKNGYSAYQIGYGEKREKLITKPVLGALKKNNIESKVTKFYEVKTSEVDAANIGTSLSVDSYGPDTFVDVTGVSKGKGFQGVMKRYNFQGGPASHGSHFHRTPGSIGNRATPGRVFAQKKMPGHMGSKQITTQNLKIVELNKAEGYLLIKGSIPGGTNCFVKISKAIKKA